MKKRNKTKDFLKKFWFLLWKDDSFKGWLFSVIFLIAFILLIFFPGLRLVTGTELPLAIVESCSMYHQGNLFSNTEAWYDRHDLKYAPFIINNLDWNDFIFKNGFNKGDILFIIGVKPEKVKQGDVIIFKVNRANPIIHRVVEVRNLNGTYHYSTIGDNNNGQLSFEKDISEDQLVGKAVVKLAPYFGWGKLIFFEASRPESERGFCSER
jgi:signal peptidase I